MNEHEKRIMILNIEIENIRNNIQDIANYSILRSEVDTACSLVKLINEIDADNKKRG